MMKKIFPAPLLSVALFVIWLLLNQSVSAGHLLLALYWVYDDSPGQARTRRLLDRGLSILKLALPLARMPLVRRPLAELLALVGEVRP